MTCWQQTPFCPPVLRWLHVFPDTSRHRPVFPDTSRHRPVHPDTSRHRPVFPDTSRHRPVFPDTSRHRPSSLTHLVTGQSSLTHAATGQWGFFIPQTARVHWVQSISNPIFHRPRVGCLHGLCQQHQTCLRFGCVSAPVSPFTGAAPDGPRPQCQLAASMTARLAQSPLWSDHSGCGAA